jgi:hypothetical protein
VSRNGKTRSPVFVLGCPRSGTTLMSRVLSGSVYGKPTETHFITKYYKRLDRYGDLGTRDCFRKLASDILSERPVMQWKLAVSPDDLWDVCERHDYAGLVHGIMQVRSTARGYESWGDKTPHYLLDLDLLVRLFSEARFIYVVRDGRDVTLSLLQRTWGPNNVYSCAVYWREYNRPRRTMELLASQGRWIRLRYEDLLRDPRRVYREVHEFLDQPVDEASGRRLAESVQSRNFGKWRERMRPAEIRLFESVAAGTLERFGYETSGEEVPVAAATRWWWQSHNAALRFKELVRLNTIEAIRIRCFGKEPFAE